MTQTVACSTALIAALGCGWTLYRGLYTAAALLAPTAIALLVIKELPKQKQVARVRLRSLSALAKLESANHVGPIQTVETLKPQTHLIPILPPPAPSRTRGPRPLFRPPPIFEEIRLEALHESGFVDRMMNKLNPYIPFAHSSPQFKPEIYDGIINLQGVHGHIRCNWDHFFGVAPFSMEVGDIAGAVARTAAKGGLWLVFTTDWSAAHEVRRERGDRPINDPLIVVCRSYCSLLFPNEGVKGIDLRYLKQGNKNIFFQTLWTINPLQEGGKLSITFRGEVELCESSHTLFNSYFTEGVKERIEGHQSRITYTRRTLEWE